MPLTDYMTKISTTVFNQADSLQKIECNLDVATQNISKLETRPTSQKEIYSDQRKDINRCISDIASLDQNNKIIHSRFEEKLNKAIQDTKQVATKLSEARNKAPAPKFQVPDSRFDNINKMIHDLDKEIQNMMNKIAIYSQKKGYFAGTHPTVPNYNNATKLFSILKPTKHQSHQTQFLSNLEHIKFSGDDILQLETTWNAIGTAFSNTFGTFRTLPKYRDLLHSDKTTIYDFLFPPKNSPFFLQAEATYFQLADALHTHLSKDKTITVEQTPKIHMNFNLKKHNPDGFLILKHIIFELSPHLGGKGPDAQERFDSFHISSEETL